MNGIQTLVKAIGLFQALIVAAPLAFATIHQNITIQLNPAQETIKAVAEIAPSTTADSPGMLLFWLNKDLQAKTPQPGVSIRKMDTVGVSSLYMVKFGGNTPSIKVEYYGSLASGPIKPISTEGVALMGNNRWYPAIDHQDYTFRITSETPAGWLTVSHDEQISETQKGQKLISVWESTSAQEDIYLISNRWHRFEKKDKGVVHRVYLMQPDAQLAEKYLKSTAQYLGLYSQMIGAYPYKQMATVENYWETGYGMPSFTLLGPKVIRFPFIFYSSFPHEILHNWWGNGVYVNLEMGNWCEGLTSYMADHYFQEMRGNGDSYRRTALLNFSVFASSGSDFPLKDFVSRHDKNSSAVGYSKGMMFFHMLKKTVGEASFAKSFREFYQEHLHRPASFEDIKNSFAKNTSTSLDQFFNQWLERTGAPKLEILNVLQQKSGAGSFQVSFELNQIHRGKPYELSVPMVFEFADGSTPVKQVYSMTDFKNRPSFTFSKRVARLSVDP